MKKILILFMFFSLRISGQCLDYDKLKTGGTYLSRTGNYIPLDPNITDTIQYCCDLKRIKKYSDKIIKNAKSYIVNRGGEKFYNNLKLESIEVNYPKNVKIEYENFDLYKLENYDVKYWIEYIYNKDNYKYAFCLYFDKEGNMISENKFPEKTKNPDFDKFSNPCDVLEIVKVDKRFNNKVIEYIELAYIDEINSFCWLVKEDHKTTKLGVSKYKVLSFYLNANSNNLEKVIKEEVISIACGFKIIKQLKKKTKKK